MKKCKKCGAPLEGFLYKTIGKLMGIKPSEQDPEICNKCAAEKSEEAKPEQESSSSQEEAPQTSEEQVTQEISDKEEEKF